MMLDPATINNPVILFDGVCNLCCSSVQFIIKRDHKKRFRFASLQSGFGKSITQNAGLNETDLSSFILREEGKIYTQSTAVLMVVKKLSALWPMLYVFIILPLFIRNAVYQFIAKNRYKWFGKKAECWIPSKELDELFIA